MAINMFEGARRIAKVIAALIVVGFVVAIFTNDPDPVSVTYLIAGPNKAPVRIGKCDSDTSTHSKEATSLSGREVIIYLCFKKPEVTKSAVSQNPKPLRVFKVKAPNGSIREVTAPEGSTSTQIIAFVKATILADPNYSNANEATKQAIRIKWGLDDDGLKWQVEAFDPDAFLAKATEQQEREFEERLNLKQTETFKIPESDQSYITRAAWIQIAKHAGLYILGMLASLAGWWAFTWTVGWIVRGFMGIPRGSDSRG